MRIEPLLQPLSADAPCGPELQKRDPEMLDVFRPSASRLPTFIKRGGQDEKLAAGSFSFSAEAAPLDDLLKTSRDLRFLVLRAQWAAVLGNLKELADSAEAIAALLQTFGDQVPPTSWGDKKKALMGSGGSAAGLNSDSAMFWPLQYLGLTETDDVTLRKLRIARGEVEESAYFTFETSEALGPLQEALGNKANEQAVNRTFAQLIRLKDALLRIESYAPDGAAAEDRLKFDRVLPVVTQMLEAITEKRADLMANAAPEPAAEATTDLAQPPQQANVPSAGTTGPSVKDRDHAKRLLERVEIYYHTYEPSSAARLLVTQARELIGSPLIEAIETLLPDKVSAATVSFGPSGLLLGVEQLRKLSAQGVPDDAEGSASGAAPAGGANEGGLQAPPATTDGPARITNAAEAEATIKSVETWFQSAERSSPVPMLLARARSYLNRDFQSIVDELIQANDP